MQLVWVSRCCRTSGSGTSTATILELCKVDLTLETLEQLVSVIHSLYTNLFDHFIPSWIFVLMGEWQGLNGFDTQKCQWITEGVRYPKSSKGARLLQTNPYIWRESYIPSQAWLMTILFKMVSEMLHLMNLTDAPARKIMNLTLCPLKLGHIILRAELAKTSRSSCPSSPGPRLEESIILKHTKELTPHNGNGLDVKANFTSCGC